MVAGAASSFPVPFVTAMTTENSVACAGHTSERMKAVIVGVHNGNGIAAAGRSCVRDDLRDFSWPIAIESSCLKARPTGSVHPRDDVSFQPTRGKSIATFTRYDK